MEKRPPRPGKIGGASWPPRLLRGFTARARTSTRSGPPKGWRASTHWRPKPSRKRSARSPHSRDRAGLRGALAQRRAGPLRLWPLAVRGGQAGRKQEPAEPEAASPPAFVAGSRKDEAAGDYGEVEYPRGPEGGDRSAREHGGEGGRSPLELPGGAVGREGARRGSPQRAREVAERLWSGRLPKHKRRFSPAEAMSSGLKCSKNAYRVPGGSSVHPRPYSSC